jgi:hypothetical protein
MTCPGCSGDQPLMMAMGRSRATFAAMPVSATASTGYWDKETEERLSSCQDAPRNNVLVGRWALDLDQCQQSPNGDASITINSHRAETLGDACNFQSIKRQSTNSWRIHALCSADGNSWDETGARLAGPPAQRSIRRGGALSPRMRVLRAPLQISA